VKSKPLITIRCYACTKWGKLGFWQ